jgi:sugar lactone lactonase YvrE
MSVTADRPPPVAALASHGAGLKRPECVLATASGDLYTADWRGGVAHLAPDGTQLLYAGGLPGGRPLRPNGIALDRDGTFLLADLGETEGGVFRLARDGAVAPVVTEVDGRRLPPTNFVMVDDRDRLWITISTSRVPRALGYRRDCDDGYIILADARGTRVVADGLGYTNEVAFHPSGRWLYVNETFVRRTSRFALHADGSLGPRETFVEYGPGTFPDGLAFDEDGFLWVVSIVSNRVLRIAPDRSIETWIEDSDPEHLDRVERAYHASELGRPHLDGVVSERLRNISSIAFGGPDRRTAYLGCLLGDTLFSFRAPAPGVALAHWRWPEA